MLTKTLEQLDGMRVAGLHPGYQIYVSVGGSVVADVSAGVAKVATDSSSEIALNDDALLLWLSACKPVAAVALCMLWERGRCELDDAVAKYVPEFGKLGKEKVTLRQVLTHTGCFPNANTGWPRVTWAQSIQAICDAPLLENGVPGRTACYHVHSGWFILGELIHRIDGRMFPEFVRAEIFEPLGMDDSWIGMPKERYDAYGSRLAAMHNSEKTPIRVDPLFREERITSCAPGSNAYGPLRELGYFYEMMLGNGKRSGVKILSPQTVAAMTARHRTGLFDLTFKHVLDWGLGVIVNSNQYGAETVPYNFGKHASPRTFGHSGNQSSCGFCDPEHGLVVAWSCNGQPGEAKHQRRANAINAAIYEDLGIGG